MTADARGAAPVGTSPPPVYLAAAGLDVEARSDNGFRHWVSGRGGG
jgi:hypothetical protein